MDPGIYDGIPNDVYQKSDGISTSFLKTFANSPKKARFGEHVTTPALEAGTLIHAAILEPTLLDSLYMPTDVPRMNSPQWALEESLSLGRVLIKRAEYDRALAMRDAVYGDPEARELLGNIRVEQAFYFPDPTTGLLRRGKADAVNDDFHCHLDVKTCEDSSRHAFRNSVGTYKYHWQQAAYTDGWELAGGWPVEGFIFLAIEKTKPYLVGKYVLDPEDVMEARFDIATLMPEVRTCLDTNIWPTNREGVVTLDRLPKHHHLNRSEGRRP